MLQECLALLEGAAEGGLAGQDSYGAMLSGIRSASLNCYVFEVKLGMA